MKQVIDYFVCAKRWRFILAGCSIILAGCATPDPRSPTQQRRLQTLDPSLSALKAEFNSDTSKPRVLALFSPTCGGCLYGAGALQAEVQVASNVTEKADLMVVWMPMLDTDNERQARKSATRFNFAGAHHFYDPSKQTSARLMAEQFPNAVREALEILPADHPKRKQLEAQQGLRPEDVPLWDAILVFPPGVTWDVHSPRPVWWTRQIGFNGEGKPGELTGLFWKSGTRQLPANSDWHLEAREALGVAQHEFGERKQP